MDLKEEVNVSCWLPYWQPYFVQLNEGKQVDFGADGSSDIQPIAVLLSFVLLLLESKLQQLIPKALHTRQSKCPAAFHKQCWFPPWFFAAKKKMLYLVKSSHLGILECMPKSQLKCLKKTFLWSLALNHERHSHHMLHCFVA